MTDADLVRLKSSVDKVVEIETTDGEHLVAKVISVFDSEDDADMFYELISSSQPERYARREENVGYSLPIATYTEQPFQTADFTFLVGFRQKYSDMREPAE